MVLLTELLPSASASSPPNQDANYRYDIFLSFRGADTRKRFTAHLYKALTKADFQTFLDDSEIETGEPLKPELESAIKSSRAAVIVLSKNYASSSWCLDELVLILEQKRSCSQIVIPIFYDVEPTDVRKQQSSFGKAMAKHNQKMETETNVEKKLEWVQKVESWKGALTEVAGLKGKVANDRMETELIEEIVKDINNRLGVPLWTTTLLQPIGMKNHIEQITSWLKDGSTHKKDILTIRGMGGIGKTYLAKYIYNLHRCEYTSSFIQDISRRCAENYHGLLKVQKQLCDDISKTSLIRVHDISVYTSMIEKALSCKKVLLVLDDVDSLDQLDALLGFKGFHSGSKIIVTTKDTSLIERCALFKTEGKPKHTECTLEGLSMDESVKLLCHHAFMCKYPNKGFEVVSEKLARYCEGHPLALDLLGRSLHNRDVGEWEDSIELLNMGPHSHIKNVLQMSFDSLPFENDKKLFKHIACFFVGMDRDVAETILSACNINTRSGIKNLTSKFLLSIGLKNKLMMHSLVQEMGRDLVRQESPEKPWERSRLWCHEESFKVLQQKKGTENLIGFALDMRLLEKEKKISGSLQLKTDALSKMDNLNLLQLNYVKMNGSYNHFSKELRWLCMHGSPLKSIPLDLPMENLVVLDMSHSNIESFYSSYSISQQVVRTVKWLIGSSSKETPLLRSLKILDLSFCEQLHSLGGFSEYPALERLTVRNCISLMEVCESVVQCVKLVYIDLSYCYKLKKLPTSICKLKKVNTLLLEGCSSCESQIETIPSNLKLIAPSLPSSLRILSLANNNLSNEYFPMDFSCLSMLEELCLDRNPIVSMPNCVRSLPRLQKLSMDRCDKVISIEHPPCSLRELSVNSSNYKRSLRKIKFDPKMSSLTLYGMSNIMSNSSLEIDGIIKIQAMEGVEENVLHSLGWSNSDFNKERRLRTYIYGSGSTRCQTQMYYEFGIFSTFYLGHEIPNWISCRSQGRSISFIIPSSPNKLRGLNLLFTFETFPKNDFCDLPMIKISNTTEKHTWIYDHFIEEVSIGEKCCLSLLSHWMFGPNEMKAGDQINVIASHRYGDMQVTKECGIGFVYDDVNIEDDNDVLSYYKSWNHIIGGDLSAFQSATGEYILDNNQFMRRSNNPYGFYPSFINLGTKYKEESLRFKAFSEKSV